MKRLSLILAAPLAGLCACATTPPPIVVADYSAQRAAYRLALANAQRYEAQGGLREDLAWLRVAEAVSAGSRSVSGDMARVEAEIDERVRRLSAEGDAALQSGDTRTAVAKYEAVLALAPQSQHARKVLRGLDAQTILAEIAHGGGGGPPARKTQNHP